MKLGQGIVAAALVLLALAVVAVSSTGASESVATDGAIVVEN